MGGGNNMVRRLSQVNFISHDRNADTTFLAPLSAALRLLELSSRRFTIQSPTRQEGSWTFCYKRMTPTRRLALSPKLHQQCPKSKREIQRKTEV